MGSEELFLETVPEVYRFYPQTSIRPGKNIRTKKFSKIRENQVKRRDKKEDENGGTRG